MLGAASLRLLLDAETDAEQDADAALILEELQDEERWEEFNPLLFACFLIVFPR